MGLPGLIEDFDISQYLTDDDDIEALKDELIEKYDSSPKMARVNIIRKGSALMCTSTPKFKILDITNYLAPCSYSAYLKHFISRKQKDFFRIITLRITTPSL